METVLLYNENPFIFRCISKVINVKEKNGKKLIQLDKTCIFPEGGGQPADFATINGEPVEIVDSYFYACVKDYNIGDEVFVKIDIEHRLEYMRLHSAEHIVSGCIFNEYGFKNVGFHMHDGIATMDIDGDFTPEMVRNIETLANEAVMDDIVIETFYPADITKITIRKYPEKDEPIRVVKIGAVDSCGCCGVHVKSTGQIGIIKILTTDRHRGGTRLAMICGKTAMLDYMQKHESVSYNSARFSVKPESLTTAIDKFIENTEDLKHKLSDITEKYYSMLAKQLTAENSNKAFIYFSDLNDANELRRLCVALSENVETAIAFGISASQRKYVIISEKKDIRPISKLLNTEFDGRGGGKPEICQGYINKGSDDEIRTFIENNIQFS